MKKRILAVLLVLAMVLSLVPAAGAAEVTTYDIGIAVYAYNDNFMALYRQELEAYFASLETDTVKYNLTIVDGQNDPAVQSQQIDTFIEQDMDAIILNLVLTSTAEDLINKIVAADIPLVLINREPTALDVEGNQIPHPGIVNNPDVCYVGTSSASAGYIQGEIVAELPNQGDMDGDGVVRYVMIQGDPENPDAQLRTENAIMALTNAGVEVEELVCSAAYWSTMNAQEIAAASLTQYAGDIDVIFCNNDGMALGAYKAIVEAGRVVGEDILLLGIDALDECINMVKNGTMTGTARNNYEEQAHQAADAAVTLLNGGSVDDYYWVPYQKIISTSDSGDIGENLTWTLTDDGTLTISGTGAMDDYGWGGAPWYAQEIKKVIIEKGITSIGAYAFYWCDSLTSVLIPDSVTSIGDFAFYWCNSLTNVTIPDSVTSIGDFAFSSCGILTGVTIPNSVTSIGYKAFSDCDNLTSVTIPDGVTSIGDEAFSWCYSLTSVTISDGVLSIGESAFSGCSSLTAITVESGNANYESIDGVLFDKATATLLQCPGGKSGAYVIPDGVTSIGYKAFADCYSLTEVTIPDDVISIGKSAFSSCSSLTEITVESGNANYESIDGVLFDKAAATLLQCPGGKSGAYVIPDGVTSIGDWALFDCWCLTSVTIPDSVTSISDWAFADCDSLTSVTIPDSVTSISDLAFTACDILTEIVFDGDAPEIGWNCFGSVTATAYYPADNATWTADVMQDYGGTITWVPYDPPVSFTDVPANAYYADEVQWAVANGITTGTSETTFSPKEDCTRAQVVTFLWRAAGEPEPTKTENPFVDVKESNYYYKAVLWAVENGITTGKDANHFAPKEVCTRAQVVTFLYRAEGQPTPGTDSNPFTDVGQGYYTDAVLWAVGEEITDGTSDNTFSPGNTCTRAQIVTFLYRYKN